MTTSTIVYKILPHGDWGAAVEAGRYDGSSDDARDGFIHLSSPEQVAGTAARHFRDRAGLVLVALDAARLGPALIWEPSRGGALFPHFHGALDPAAALSVTPLPLGADGIPVVPKDLPSC